MNTDQTQKIMRLFDELMDLPEPEQAERLRAGTVDPEIVAEVERMLMKDRAQDPVSAPSSLLPTGGIVRMPDVLDRTLRQAGIDDPDHIGAYRVIEKIGEGGFGIVYRCEQDAPVQRSVAIKVIKPGMDSRQVLARFEAERQALSFMDHECIARIIDAGAGEDGRPYFVMELVRGVPITEYCDVNRLTVVERLELFVRVCEAVQHAHSKGVVHRDLKPANILVTYDGDGQPIPKVIDFGVARALDGRARAIEAITEVGQLIGTLEYMSPEQAELSASDIDTRTDVYSLGVVLYELLAGVTPFEAKELRKAGLAEVHRIIRVQEPPRPSRRVHTLSTIGGDSAASVTSLRRTELRSLISVLRRDLDWVVMRCLEKDRRRRYATPTELAQDLRRFLSVEPVLAGPPSVVYRARKFVLRNRGATVGIAISVVAVVGGAIVATGGMISAQAGQRKARQETAAVRSVLDFLRDELLLQDHPHKLGADVTLREAVISAARASRERFSDQPDLGVRIQLPIVESLVDLGELDEADALLTRAETARSTGETNSVELARLRADITRERGNLRASIASLEPLLHPPEDPSAWTMQQQRVFDSLVVSMLARGNESEAADLITPRLEALRDRGGGESERAIRMLIALSNALLQDGEADQAAIVAKEARDLSHRLGEDDPLAIMAASNYGMALLRTDAIDAASQILRANLEARRTVYGDDHFRTAMGYENLARLAEVQGEMAQSETWWRHATNVAERAHGTGSRLHLTYLNNLGALHTRQEEWQDAGEYFGRALELARRNLSLDAEDLAIYLNNYANALTHSGEPERAINLLREALERAESGIARPSTRCYAHSNLGDALAWMGGQTEDETLVREAVAHYRSASDCWDEAEMPQAENRFHAVYTAGALLYRLQEYSEASEYFEKLIEMRRGSPWEDLADYSAWEHAVLGSCYSESGRFAEAEKVLLTSYSFYEGTEGEYAVRFARVIEHLTRLYVEWNKQSPTTARAEAAEHWRARRAQMNDAVEP